MLREMCKSKIHRAVITEANVNYEGSITIDRHVMQAANLYPFERVQIANITTGVRLETYVIEGEAHSGVIGINGAAARLAKAGDKIHIISYAHMDDKTALQFRPKIVHLDEKNQIRTTVSGEGLPVGRQG